MEKLQDGDIVRIIREEYARKLTRLTEKLDIGVVSQGLKVRDENDLQYTVTRCGSWGVELSYVGQNGAISYKKVDKSEFEKNFCTPVEAHKEAAKKAKEAGAGDEEEGNKDE